MRVDETCNSSSHLIANSHRLSCIVNSYQLWAGSNSDERSRDPEIPHLLTTLMPVWPSLKSQWSNNSLNHSNIPSNWKLPHHWIKEIKINKPVNQPFNIPEGKLAWFRKFFNTFLRLNYCNWLGRRWPENKWSHGCTRHFTYAVKNMLRINVINNKDTVPFRTS